MPIPILLLTVAGGLGLAALFGCEAKDKEENLLHPAPPVSVPPPNEKSTFSCLGERSALDLGPHRLEFCHEDKNKDGVVNFETDALTIWDEEKTVAATELPRFAEFQKKYRLPNFQGLNLAKWLDLSRFAHQIKFTQWKSEEEARFAAVVNFAQKNGIDLAEAKGWVQKIKPNLFKSLTLSESTHALLVISLLLKLKKDQNPFYQKNHEALDGILQRVEEGKLKVQVTSPENPDEKATMGAIYRQETNTIEFMSAFSELDSNFSLAVTLHELFHFYQDSKKSPLTLIQLEKEAYLMEAEFLFQVEGLDKKDTKPADVEKVVQKYLTEKYLLDADQPIIPAIWARYYQTHPDPKKLKENQQKLEAAVLFTSTLHNVNAIAMLAGQTPHYLIWREKADSALAEPSKKEEVLKYFEKQIRMIREDKSVALTNMNKDPSKDHQNAYLSNWAVMTILQSLIMEVSSGSLNPDASTVEKFDSPIKNEMKEELQTAKGLFSETQVFDGID